MNLISTRFVLIGAICVLCAVVNADDLPSGDTEKLIQSLGDKDYRIREEATAILLKKKDATEALKKATESKDRETARRARLILDSFEVRPDDKSIETLQSIAKANKIDMAVEYLLLKPIWSEDTRRLNILTMQLQDCTSDAAKQFEIKDFATPKPKGPKLTPGQITMPLGDITIWERSVNPQFYSGVEHNLVQEKGPHRKVMAICGRKVVLSGSFTSCLVLAADKLSVQGQEETLARCVLYSGGPIEVEDTIVDSIIICDGPFHANKIGGCLLIVNGPVHLKQAAINCHIITTDTVGYEDAIPNSKNTIIKDKEKNLLGLVKFFDLADEGLIIKSVEKKIIVQELLKNKRFAMTELKPGDVIAGFEGKALTSPDELRRMCRIRLAVSGTPFILNIVRDGTKIDVPVK